MRNHSKLTMAALIGAATLAAGCTTPAGPPPEGGYRIDNQNVTRPTLNTVRVIDGSLAQYRDRQYNVRSVLDVENIVVSNTGTGLKRISVELRNKAQVEIPLEVRTSWYDPSGRPVDAAASWNRLFAKPMSMALYEHVSSSPAAQQYYVEVRAAQ
ncbi:MAG TPA: DUF1425 domain-containing protein [Allosphingosinicella sp.]|jgi:uncharacterized protein YcfL|uniref:DUF1425 domain-containing protein n=1 Tax=Allosphingosinicella sp. TaxID=2823234 RepID=UPI002F26F6B1